MNILDSMNKEQAELFLDSQWKMYRVSSSPRMRQISIEKGKDWKKDLEVQYEIILKIEDYIFDKFYNKSQEN